MEYWPWRLEKPNKLQMLSAVRGHDYRYHRRSPVWPLALGIALIIGGVWGLFLLWESML